MRAKMPPFFRVAERRRVYRLLAMVMLAGEPDAAGHALRRSLLAVLKELRDDHEREGERGAVMSAMMGEMLQRLDNAADALGILELMEGLFRPLSAEERLTLTSIQPARSSHEFAYALVRMCDAMTDAPGRQDGPGEGVDAS